MRMVRVDSFSLSKMVISFMGEIVIKEKCPQTILVCIKKLPIMSKHFSRITSFKNKLECVYQTNRS